MSGEGVIMLIAKNTKTEVVRVRDIDTVVGVGDIDMVVETEETIRVD